MRNRYRITVTDYRGSRHYTLTQIMLRRIGMGTVVLAVMLFGGALLIHTLNGTAERLGAELKELKAQHAAIRENNRRLLADQDHLIASVDSKARELIVLSDELEHIETYIGLRPRPNLPLTERVDIAAQTAHQKRLMLESIPSGYPLLSPELTSGFGMRRHPVNGNRALHGGVDLRAGRGTPVHATADGVVEYAAHSGSSGPGKMVRLVHNYGFTTVYAHLDEFQVGAGDYVRKGQLIARSGNTGVTNAPHLHYEVRYLGRRLDPRPFLDWSLERYELVFEQEERVQWDSLAATVRRNTNGPQRPWSQPAQSLSATSP